MARSVARLASTSLTGKGNGLYPDGAGLYFQVKNGGRSWLFRFTLAGRARWMGLGAYPEVSLAQAREKAGKCRNLLREGVDPIEARKAKRQAAQLEAARAVTFQDCAKRYIEAHKPGWRNAKHAAQWGSTLATYAYPVFGSFPVQSVDTGLVTKALEAIWTTKPETASRLRQRIEAVLDWAGARGYRGSNNPARWKGHLDKLLPRRSRVRAVKHFEALPYADFPQFYSELTGRETISAWALTFLILTAARSGEVRGARWAEIDLGNKVWTVPADRMKSRREHRVPLTDSALDVLRRLPTDQPAEALIFPSPNNSQKPMSDTAMRKYLQEELGKPGLTVHGFRSTFRDWTAEETNCPRELAEASLGHVLKDKTEAAYQRGDLLAKRRKLMDAWGRSATSGPAAKGKVLPFTRTASS